MQPSKVFFISRRLLFWVQLFYFALIPFFAQAQSIESRLQDVLDSASAKYPESVGVMAHIEMPSRNISWSGAKGFANKKTNQPLSPDRPVLIASNTKTYVAATILRLVEEDKLSIDDPIEKLLTKETKTLFAGNGFDLNRIRVKNLLSHTSGIPDYVNEAYLTEVNENKTRHWTREEQLARAAALKPLGQPGFAYRYSDTNYLLLSEIIEQVTGKPFYKAMRQLLRYDALGLDDIWMPGFEEKPGQTLAPAHQYWQTFEWDSYDLDPSIDMYGGGGIAATTHDLALFGYDLFAGKVVKEPSVLNLIYTDIPTSDGKSNYYFFGITEYFFADTLSAYGHDGFWGTRMLYFPDLDASIAIFYLEHDANKVMDLILNDILKIIKE